MNRTIVILGLVSGLAWGTHTGFAQTPSTRPGESTSSASRQGANDAAALTARAVRVVGTLKLDDAQKSERAKAALTEFYVSVGAIHAARDARMDEIKKGADKAAATQASTAVDVETVERLRREHGAFVSKVSAELSQEQLDQLKDEMTENLVPGRMQRYAAIAPDLTEAQREHVRSMLVEWRETAMDIVDLKAQDRTIGKVEGKINNYLKSQGVEAKRTTKPPATTQSAK